MMTTFSLTSYTSTLVWSHDQSRQTHLPRQQNTRHSTLLNHANMQSHGLLDPSSAHHDMDSSSGCITRPTGAGTDDHENMTCTEFIASTYASEWGTKSGTVRVFTVLKYLIKLGVIASLFYTSIRAHQEIDRVNAELNAIKQETSVAVSAIGSVEARLTQLDEQGEQLNTSISTAVHIAGEVQAEVVHQNVTIHRTEALSETLKLEVEQSEAKAQTINSSLSSFAGTFRKVVEGTELSVNGQAVDYILQVPYRCATPYGLKSGTGSSINVEYVSMAVTALDTSKCVQTAFPYDGCFYRFEVQEEFCTVCTGSSFCNGTSDSDLWVVIHVYLRKQGDVLCTMMQTPAIGYGNPSCIKIDPSSFRVFALTPSTGFRRQIISLYKRINATVSV